MELEKELAKRIEKIEFLLSELKVIPIKLIGRVKSKESISEKQKCIESSEVKENLGISDLFGIRIIVKTEDELKRVYVHLIEKENVIFIKDYVNNPRRDGLIIGGNVERGISIISYFCRFIKRHTG